MPRPSRRGAPPPPRLGSAAVLALLVVAAACGSTPNATGPESATTNGPSLPPRTTSPSSSAAAAPPTTTPSTTTTTGPAPTPTGPALTDVLFASRTDGWVVGAGLILGTTDAGTTWTPQYEGAATLDSLDATTTLSAWAVGPSVLLRTTDGGADWSQLPEPARTVDTVHFVNASLGWAVAGGRVGGGGVGPGGPVPATGGVLLRSTDGGLAWRRVRGAPSDVESACFVGPRRGWLVASVAGEATIERTLDGGRTWSAVYTPALAARVDADSFPSARIECAHGAVWAMFLGQGAALGHVPYLDVWGSRVGRWSQVLEESYTESGTLATQSPDGPGTYPGTFSAVSADSAVFVGFDPNLPGSGAPFVTVTATAVSPRGSVAGVWEPAGAAFLGPRLGWVVGLVTSSNPLVGPSTDVVERTTDGGAVWRVQYETGV